MTRPLLLALVVILLSACSGEAAPTPVVSSSTSATTSAVGAADALERLDTRLPVPLLPMMANHQKRNMRDHLLAVQEIVSALASEDFAAVERATGRIGFSEQMGQMCTHMGSGAPRFAELALAFHHTADRIASAARDRDRAGVLAELGTTLQFCTSCHETWKQQVVDESTWQRLTASAPPSHGAQH